MPTAYGVIHLLPKLPEFLARHPEVTLETDPNDRIVNMVEESFDVAVRVGELTDSSLIGRRLAANRRGLAAAPTYLPGKLGGAPSGDRVCRYEESQVGGVTVKKK